MAVTEEDKKFKALVERDQDEATLAAGEEVVREEKRIVGKAPRGSMDTDVLGGKTLTVEQKVDKEITFIKEALDLTDAQAKHWRYKLKREYEAQERREKLMQ